MYVASTVVLTLASGCASTGGGGGGQMQNTVYATHRLVQNLDRNLSGSVNKLNETTADLVARVEASDTENRRVRSLVEENQKRLEDLQQALDNLTTVLYRELELSPPSTVGRSVTPPPVDSSSEVRPGRVEVQSPPAVVTAAPPIATPPDSNAEAAPDHYRHAQQLYLRDEFALALEEFDSYLRLYPNTENAGNAQYWKAHCHLKMDEFDQAISEFKVLVRDYPSNIKVPFALINQAVSCSRLGQNDKARALFEKTISDYPNDAAAPRAREYLRQMGDID
jgi:tol-pal system protein YbgF